MKVISFLIGVILISCHSGKELSTKWNLELTQKSEFDINYSFENVGTHSYGGKYPVSLWNQLNNIPARSNNYNNQLTMDSSLSVNLQLSSDSSKLNAFLVSNGSVIDELTYSGRVINNYFYIDQFTKKLFTPIIWYINHSQMIISSEQNDSLTLIHLKSDLGAFLLFIGTKGGGKSISKFNKN